MPQIKQRQEHIGHVLSTNNIRFEVIDVAASQPALQYMKRQNNGGSTRGRAKELPQVFVGGQYRGVSNLLKSPTIVPTFHILTSSFTLAIPRSHKCGRSRRSERVSPVH